MIVGDAQAHGDKSVGTLIRQRIAKVSRVYTVQEYLVYILCRTFCVCTVEACLVYVLVQGEKQSQCKFANTGNYRWK